MTEPEDLPAPRKRNGTGMLIGGAGFFALLWGGPELEVMFMRSTNVDTPACHEYLENRINGLERAGTFLGGKFLRARDRLFGTNYGTSLNERFERNEARAEACRESYGPGSETAQKGP